jgi:hypothetical protein
MANRFRVKTVKPIRILVPVLLFATLFGPLGAAAQTGLENLYPGFFEPANPQVLDAIFFAGGFGSSKYSSAQEGLQVEQSLTPYLGVLGRFTGYQLWISDNADNPLEPGTGHSAHLSFGRLQGGFEFAVYPGTRFFILGGRDVGDSDAPIVEGDLSSWLFAHSPHPANVSFSASHNYQNHVTSSEIDLRLALFSTEDYLVTAGAGGAIYGGGVISDVAGQGGPDLGVYFRQWGFGIDVQAGYGTAEGFGQLSLIKQFDFVE